MSILGRTAWTIVLALAAPAPGNITGGTPAERDRLAKAVASVPECLRECDGTPVPCEIQRNDEPNATYYAEDPVAFLNGKPAKPVIRYHDALLDPKKLDIAVEWSQKQFPCIQKKHLEWMQNAERVMLHEFAHHFHFSCATGKKDNEDLLDDFLALPGGFNDKIKKGQADESLTEASEAVNDALANRPADAEKQVAWKKELCAAADRYVAQFRRNGFPSRHPYDAHASEGTRGSEYIAIAVETLIYDHDEFCRSYSEAEQKWLKKNLGACLAQLKNRAPCYDELAAKPPTEVAADLEDLTDHLNPGEPACTEPKK